MSGIMSQNKKNGAGESNLRQQNEAEKPAEMTTYDHNDRDVRYTDGDYAPVNDETMADDERMHYLDDKDETLYMQVYVEEVGLWMDSMDPMKHVCRTRIACLTCLISLTGP